MKSLLSGWMTSISKKMGKTELARPTSQSSDVALKVQGELNVFRDRVMALRRRLYICSIIVGGALAAGLGLFALASSMSLPDTLTVIDIPSAVSKLYEAKNAYDQVQSGRDGFAPGSIAALGAGVSDLLNGTLPKVLGFMMIAMGVVGCVIRQSPSSLVVSIFGGVMMMSMGPLMDAIAPEELGRHSTERAQVKAIEDLTFKELKAVLPSLPGIAEGDKRYVLAQASMRDFVIGAEAEMEATIKDLRSDKPSVSDVPDEIAYLLQNKYDGKMLTDASKAFVADFNDRVAFLKSAAYTLLFPSLFAALALLVATAVSMYLQARATRVDEMLDELGWKPAEDSPQVTD